MELETRKISFDDARLFYDDDSIYSSSDEDKIHPSESINSDLSSEKSFRAEILDSKLTPSNPLKNFPLIVKKENNDKIYVKNNAIGVKSKGSLSVKTSRATTAKVRPDTAAKLREYPVRLKFPVNRINISRPQTASMPVKLPEVIKVALSRPPTSKTAKSLHSRPETAFNLSDWDSRPHTARFKEKLIVKTAPINRFLPVPDKTLGGELKRLFSAQKEIEYTNFRDRTNSMVPAQLEEIRKREDEVVGKFLQLETYYPAESRCESLQSSLSDIMASVDAGELLEESYRGAMHAQKETSPSFIITHGQINQDSCVFKMFLRESVQKVGLSIHLVQYFFEKLQVFALDYNVTYGEVSFSKAHYLLSKSNSWRMLNKWNLVSIMQNEDVVSRQVKSWGRRFTGRRNKEAAASKIQATYRMIKQKRIFRFYKFQKKCASTIITYFRNRIKKRERIMAQAKLLDGSHDIVKELNSKFQEAWEKDYLLNPEGRTIVLINSLAFDSKLRLRMDMAEEQKNNYGRLVQLLDDSVSVVFITPEMSVAERHYLKSILSVYWDYSELIQTKRLKIYEVVRPMFFFKDAALTTMLLMNSALMVSIASHIANTKVYVESLIASKEDCRFCEILQIPMYGTPSLALEFSHKRVKQRKFALESGSKVPPGFVFTPKSLSMGVIKVFSDLTNGNPSVTRWIMKINDFGMGEGLAILTLPSTIKRPVKFSQDDVSNNIKFVSSSWNGDWRVFLKAFVTYGGLIEAYATTDKPHYVAIHMDITPDLRLLNSGSNSLVCFSYRNSYI